MVGQRGPPQERHYRQSVRPHAVWPTISRTPSLCNRLLHHCLGGEHKGVLEVEAPFHNRDAGVAEEPQNLPFGMCSCGVAKHFDDRGVRVLQTVDLKDIAIELVQRIGHRAGTGVTALAMNHD
jgi:hypothetical protein